MKDTIAILIAAVLTVAGAATAAHAASGGPLPIGDPAGLARQGRWLELDALQSQQRMLQYQRDHQRFMEDLRRVPPAEQVRPEVPRMERTCQVPVYGNQFLRSCR